MNKNLKRLFPLFAAACCLTTTAFAYDGEETNKKHNAAHAVPPPQHPGGPDALSFYVGAAYTYWVPYQEGMNLAIGNPTSTTGNEGNVLRAAMNGASGFKVFLGANTHHDGWVAGLNYTWFNYAPKMKANTLITDVTYQGVFSDNAFTSLESKFYSQFNRIDATLGRSFYAGHYMTFRPWLGLLGAWDTQHLKYNSVVTSTVTEKARMTQSWWGIGPYAGGEGTYYFANDWGLYISSGASLLLANHAVTMENLDYTDGQATTVNSNYKTAPNSVDPMLETTLGLRWDSNWTDWALCIDLGWELQTYFNHNGFQGINNSVGNMGTFSMQGLTLAVKVNF